jgi:hypothetical protein
MGPANGTQPAVVTQFSRSSPVFIDSRVSRFFVAVLLRMTPKVAVILNEVKDLPFKNESLPNRLA